MTLVATGSNLRAYIGGTLLMEGTDTTHTAAGLVGYLATGSAASSTTGVHIDNLLAGPAVYA